MRRRGWVALGILCGLAALAATRWQISRTGPVREAWTLIALTADPGVLWASGTVSDAGLLRDWMTTRLGWLGPFGPVLEHRATWGPATLTEKGVEAGLDRFHFGDDGWTVEIGGEQLSGHLRLAAASGCPPEVGDLYGHIRAEPSGRTASGRGVMVRTQVQGRAEGVAIYALDRRMSLGIDPWSHCPAWISGPGVSWTGDPPTIPLERRWSGELGDYELDIRAVGRRLVMDEHEHLLPPERLLAEIVGYPAPTITLQRVRVRLPGSTITGPLPGVRIVRGTRGWRD